MAELTNFCQPRTVYECTVPVRDQPMCKYFMADPTRQTRCLHRDFMTDPATCECKKASEKP